MVIDCPLLHAYYVNSPGPVQWSLAHGAHGRSNGDIIASLGARSEAEISTAVVSEPDTLKGLVPRLQYCAPGNEAVSISVEWPLHV